MKNQNPTTGKSSSHNPPSSAHRKKIRWDSDNASPKPRNPSNSKPSNPSNPNEDTPGPPALPPPNHPVPSPVPTPPPYGFHNLERRTIVLADGSVRSYFALPPEEPVGTATRPRLGLGFERRYPPQEEDYWSSLGLNRLRGPPEGEPASVKRKYVEEDEFAWLRESVRRYGNPEANPNGLLGRESKQMKLGGESDDNLPSNISQSENDKPSLGGNVEPQALKKAFLKFSKLINENLSERNKYLENGKNGPLWCIACGRTSKAFAGVHDLIMHAYTSQKADLHIDHLGLHKALCVLMGWNYAKAPETSKAYQSLSADDATANREDLIIWPPTVIIHNTTSGRRKDGRMDGMSNKEMDTKLKELGFAGGTSNSLFGKGGHMGVTAVKFACTQAGLKEAERLVEYFEKDNRGRRGWAPAGASQTGDDEENPALVKVDEKTGEKKRIFYGYLATASDLEKVDIDTRKRAIIKSRREFDPSD